jgi:hypothetical protein
MKKTLNTQAISSELSQSRFFQRPQPTQPQQLETEQPTQQQTKPEPSPTPPAAQQRTPSVLASPAKRPLDYKGTVEISMQDYERFEDIKTEIRRKYDLSLAKQDLFYCGMLTLLDEYQQHGEDSILIRYLKSKKTK